MYLKFARCGVQRHLHVSAIGQMREVVKESQPFHCRLLAPHLMLGRIVAEDFDGSNGGTVRVPHRLNTRIPRDRATLLVPQEDIRFVQASVMNACREGTTLL